MGDGESHISAFESLLRQVARAPGYDGSGDAEPIEAGAVVGDRFEIVRELGSGGFARVYEARDRVLGRRVAIKLLRRRRRLSDREMSLFYREAQATARLNHPNIVTAHDWGEWSGTPFLVLELLDGESLAQHIDGPVGERRALEIAREITAALRYAHDAGVLHLDLKSQNVVVQRDGPIKVLDFGLAGLEGGDEAPDETRVGGGTPATMAPEQRRGDSTDARTDIWAVGVILHELLFGALPPRSAGELAEPPPRRCAPILSRTLAADPGDRFADAAALHDAIEAALAPRRWKWWIAAAAVSVAAVTAILTGVLGGDTALIDDLPAAPAAEPEHRQLTFRGDVFHSALSPDGRWIAYLTTNNTELWIEPIDGARQRRRLFEHPGLSWPAFTDDGERVIVCSRDAPRSSWLVSIADGSASPLPITSFDYGVSFGDSLAASWLNLPTIRVAPLAGGEPRTLTVPGAKWVFGVDADRRGRLLVTTFSGDSGSLVALGGGSSTRVLHRSRRELWSGVWARGGGAYFVASPGPDGEIQYLPPEPGASPSTVATGFGVGHRIAISDDGRRLLYHRDEPVVSIDRLLVGRGRIQPITRTTATMLGVGVAPDGRTVAIALRESRDTYSLRIESVDPDEPRRRIDCASPCGSPAWSPRGDRIAVRWRVDESTWRIAIIDARTGETEVLEETRATLDNMPAIAWLSESEILYVPIFNERLRVAGLDGGDRNFVEDATAGWMFNPVVSSDRQRVAFFWNDDDQASYIADRNGSNVARVVAGLGMPIGFDGDRLMVAKLRADNTIGRIDSVTRGGETEPFWAPQPGYQAIEAAVIPGSRDLLLTRTEPRSDAWLIENP